MFSAEDRESVDRLTHCCLDAAQQLCECIRPCTSTLLDPPPRAEMSLYRSITLFVLSCWSSSVSNILKTTRTLITREPVTRTPRWRTLGQTGCVACPGRLTRQTAQHHIGSRSAPNQCSCLRIVELSNREHLCFEVRSLTFHDHPLRLVPIFCDKPFDTLVMLHEVECLSVSPYGLHQADSVGIHTLGILGHICDRMWHLETKPEQVTNVLEQRDDLRIEVDRELEATPA
jgi:hypothetical protein